MNWPAHEQPEKTSENVAQFLANLTTLYPESGTSEPERTLQQALERLIASSLGYETQEHAHQKAARDKLAHLAQKAEPDSIEILGNALGDAETGFVDTAIAAAKLANAPINLMESLEIEDASPEQAKKKKFLAIIAALQGIGTGQSFLGGTEHVAKELSRLGRNNAARALATAQRDYLQTCIHTTTALIEAREERRTSFRGAQRATGHVRRRVSHSATKNQKDHPNA